MLVLLLVAGYATPKIVAVLKERDDKIEGNLKRAEQLKAEAAHILSEYQKTIASAQEKSRKIVADAQNETGNRLKEKEKEFLETLNVKIAESEAILREEKNKALTELKDLSQILTAQIVAKLIDVDANSPELKDDIAKAMEKVI